MAQLFFSAPVPRPAPFVYAKAGSMIRLRWMRLGCSMVFTMLRAVPCGPLRGLACVAYTHHGQLQHSLARPVKRDSRVSCSAFFSR